MARITKERLAAATSTSPTLLEALPRFRRYLAQANKAPRTIESYAEAVDLLNRYMTAAGMPTRLAAITSEHVGAFMEDQLQRRSAASARVRYASLRAFWKWAVEDGELTVSPLARVPQPAVPEKPVPVLTEDELKALVRACESEPDFLGRRDAGIVRLLVDTGARLSEVAGLRVEDVNLEQATVSVLGKGRRVRHLPIGTRTARAMDRYLAVRGRHPDHALPALWLGTQGPLTKYGIVELVKRRAKQAGIPELHVHQLRHSTAHYLRLHGMDDDSVMRLMGWRDRSMLHRYGASAADERAREAHRRLSPGDRI